MRACRDHEHAVLGQLAARDLLQPLERFGRHAELEHVDLVVLNDTTALLSGNPLNGMQDGGAVFMQSPFTEPAEVWQRIPEHHKQTIRTKELRVYFTDMVKIASKVAIVQDCGFVIDTSSFTITLIILA
mgnify:CR=1 FL=1